MFHEPFGFLDYNKLQRRRSCVLSDSGTVSEESGAARVPGGDAPGPIERPEALDSGAMVTAGVTPSSVTEAVRFVRAGVSSPPSGGPVEYSVPDTARRVVAVILGTAHAHHANAGIRRRQ